MREKLAGFVKGHTTTSFCVRYVFCYKTQRLYNALVSHGQVSLPGVVKNGGYNESNIGPLCRTELATRGYLVVLYMKYLVCVILSNM